MGCGLDPGLGKVPCRRKWQPTPVFLPGKSHQQRSLAHYSSCGHKELDTTEPKACAEAYSTLFVHCLHKAICACIGERTWMLTSYVAWSRLCPMCPAGNDHFPWGRVRLRWSEFGVSVCLASRDRVLWGPWPSSEVRYQPCTLHLPFDGFPETLILILVGAVPVPLMHFNYFDFLKPPGRGRTNSWIYLIRNFILSESLGINTLHFMGRSVLLDEPTVSIQMKSWSRAWLWSSENNQCSKKPLCLQPKAGFTWIYRDASLMDDVVIWHKYNCESNNMFVLSEPCVRPIVKVTLIEKSPGIS